MERHGFYSGGGGLVIVEIEPARDARPLELAARGKPISRLATAIVSRLSVDIAERELSVLRERLRLKSDETELVKHRESDRAGNVVMVELRYEQSHRGLLRGRPDRQVRGGAGPRAFG